MVTTITGRRLVRGLFREEGNKLQRADHTCHHMSRLFVFPSANQSLSHLPHASPRLLFRCHDNGSGSLTIPEPVVFRVVDNGCAFASWPRTIYCIVQGGTGISGISLEVQMWGCLVFRSEKWQEKARGTVNLIPSPRLTTPFSGKERKEKKLKKIELEWEGREGRGKKKNNRTKKNVCSSDAVMLPSLRGMMVCDERPFVDRMRMNVGQ